LLRPAALALISKRASGGQGAAMGLSNSFISLGRIAGPVWAGFAFEAHINYPYLSGSLIMFSGFLLALALIAPQGVEAVDDRVEAAKVDAV
jgi:DHA1 family multidrug resistance protein-like MFS transporter